LRLISPTVNNSGDSYEWFSDWFAACYRQRDIEGGCDVETIDVWNVHGYRCSENWWRVQYEGDDSVFFERMQEEIEAKLTEEELDTIDVHDYLTSREIWVTEFNCNQDGDCPTSEE